MGLADVGLGRHILRLGIVQTQHGDGGAEHVHWRRLAGAGQEIGYALGKAR